ncbi:hypothetical protein HY612_03065 [Candidatus Roizmanbacteria bacterium]|nr:hypothetical protein [Candidatus Roizmanbacteria bacterium]
MQRLNAKQLRELEVKRAMGKIRNVKRNPIYFILENVYDTYNVGGLFRLADAVAAEKIYLCGDTEIPPNSRIKKASIGTYKIVDWQYKKSAKEAINDILKSTQHPIRHSGEERSDDSRIVVINNDPAKGGMTMQIPKSIRQAQDPEYIEGQVRNDNEIIKQFNNETMIVAVEQHPKSTDYRKTDYRLPLALIFGNESYGVTPETLKLVDQIVEIPMWGINKSLNVIVSAAIVSYWVMNKL